MGYDEQTGQEVFMPEYDPDDQETLNKFDKLQQAAHYRQQQQFTQYQQGAFANGVQKALDEFGITAQQFEQMAASAPQDTAVANQTSGYMIAKSVIEGAQNRVGERPRDSQGRFAPSPKAATKGASKTRKSVQEYRDQVQKSGKISGDSTEAIDVLEALLAQ